MKKLIFALICFLAFSTSFCQAQLSKTVNAINAVNTNTKRPASLSNEDVIKGLKEALSIGTNKSSSVASKMDGFYKNPEIFIPFPSEAQKVKDWATKIGMNAQLDKFIMTLNRSAEEAAKDAAPIFLNAIKEMGIGDGFTILKGSNSAATEYLKDKTAKELSQKFTPIVQNAINKVQLTKYWDPIINKYNKLPLVKKQNPDLTAYVTEKTIEGLFKLIAKEELEIRKNPAARMTDLLARVFN